MSLRVNRKKKQSRARQRARANSLIVTLRTANLAGTANATRFLGNVWDASFQSNSDLFSTDMLFESTLVSTIGGFISNVFDQSMTGLANWASFASIYHQFRVLAFTLEFFPANRYSKTTTSCQPGFGVVDRDDNSGLISLALAAAFSSARMLSLEDPWTDRREYRGSSVPALIWRMETIDEAAWLSTAAPSGTGRGSIKLFFAGLTASTTYGLVTQRVLVQFRGKF